MKFIKWSLVGVALCGLGLTAHAEVKIRSEVEDAYKWDFSLIYPSWDAWEADLAKVGTIGDEIASLEGTLAEGPQQIVKLEQLSDEIGKLAYRLYGYSGLQRDINLSDNDLLARWGQFMGAFQSMEQKLSWITPEMLNIPEATMMEWIDSTPELQIYRFPISETYRLQEHVLNAEGEKLLSYFSKMGTVPSGIYAAISTADAKPMPITLSDGESFEVTAGSYAMAMTTSRNQADRKLIQKTLSQSIIDQKNTYAAIYDAALSSGWAEAQARNYESVLASQLDGDNVPMEVFTNLIETAKDAKETLRRYHHLRQKVLGLETYGWSDCMFPIVDDKTQYPFEDIKPRIISSVALLGEAYQKELASLFENGQIDVYESVGKRTGAYSSGIYGIGPFVLLNYHDAMEDAFTLAHELGHSMHTQLSDANQPFATSDYTIFVAEVASTFNEKLFLGELLKEVTTPEQRIALLEHQIQDIIGTFITQTLFADFELKAHTLVESGETLTADRLTQIWRETTAEYYGDIIPADDPYMYSWARIPHFYNTPYYVYKYATCYASSSSIYKAVQTASSEADKAEIIHRYLTLLSSGGNDFPIRQLQKAGVDLTKPEATENVVKELDRLVSELEAACAEL
ncbi:MAG: oligoendopeptidase F [Opitutales bacterium]|nr:oligoendopeptidase F [Opitutales bacterium]